MRPRDLPLLTALRFFAAMLVVFYHYGNVAHGYAAVAFFFALSGFVLAHSYVDGDQAMRGTRQAFWKARVARLLPMYLIAWLLSAPFALRSGESPLTVLATLPPTQAWFPSLAMAGNPPAWSIAVEVFFYALFPFVAPRLARLRGGALRGAIVVAFLLALAAPALAPDLPVAVLKFNPLFHLGSFIAGILAQRLFVETGGLARPRPVLFAASTAAFLGILSVDLGPFALFVHNGALIPLTVPLLIGAASLPVVPPRFLLALGQASYGIYLLQHPLNCFFTGITKQHDGLGPFAMAMFCVFLVAASLAAHALIERPFRRIYLPRARGVS